MGWGQEGGGGLGGGGGSSRGRVRTLGHEATPGCFSVVLLSSNND